MLTEFPQALFHVPLSVCGQDPNSLIFHDMPFSPKSWHICPTLDDAFNTIPLATRFQKALYTKEETELLSFARGARQSKLHTEPPHPHPPLKSSLSSNLLPEAFAHSKDFSFSPGSLIARSPQRAGNI